MVYTMKIEPRAYLLHTTTRLNDSKILSKHKALQTLSTELYIVKDLASSRLFKETRGECPNASFNLVAEMGRAMRMSRPGQRRHGNSTTPRNLSLYQFGKRQQAQKYKWQCNGRVLGNVRIGSYKLLL
jgi:hypothetical protein